MLTAESVSIHRGPQGDIRLAFEEAVYAQAAPVFYNASSKEVTGLINGLPVRLGTMPKSLADVFSKQDSVVLTAPHFQGHELAFSVPVFRTH